MHQSYLKCFTIQLKDHPKAKICCFVNAVYQLFIYVQQYLNLKSIHFTELHFTNSSSEAIERDADNYDMSVDVFD